MSSISPRGPQLSRPPTSPPLVACPRRSKPDRTTRRRRPSRPRRRSEGLAGRLAAHQPGRRSSQRRCGRRRADGERRCGRQAAAVGTEQVSCAQDEQRRCDVAELELGRGCESSRTPVQRRREETRQHTCRDLVTGVAEERRRTHAPHPTGQPAILLLSNVIRLNSHLDASIVSPRPPSVARDFRCPSMTSPRRRLLVWIGTDRVQRFENAAQFGGSCLQILRDRVAAGLA